MGRFSLQTVISWIGVASVVGFFLSLAAAVGYRLNTIEEQSLRQRGLMLAEMLAQEAIEPLLVDDRYGVEVALQRTVETQSDVRYAFLADPHGRVLGHSFEDGFPRQFLALCEPRKDSVLPFHTLEEHLLDIRATLLDGRLGALHLGVSQNALVEEQRRFLALISATGVIMLFGALWAARKVGDEVGGPLRELAAVARAVPQGDIRPDQVPLAGTSEVQELAESFRIMVEDLHRLEAENAAAARRLAATEHLAALGELAAGLAHEVVNPLDGVLECSRALQRRDPSPERLERYLKLMHDGLTRIDRVMRQMLLFARAPNVQTELAECDASEMLSAVLQFVEVRLQKQGVKITREVNGNPRCYCCRELAEQVMLNLLLNAMDALSAAEERSLALVCERVEPWVNMRVDDSGPGVPDALGERIFDAFFTSKDVGKGTGMGLTVSRQLAREFGGDLIYAGPSSLGGASFVLKLPTLATARERTLSI
jgi:signal transduction histidine kinase